MNKDIRLSVDFFQHHKTKRLKRKLGVEGIIALQQLWCYAARNRPKGSLTDMDAEDIASVCDWDGDEQQFVSCLCDIGFLEQCEEGIYHIHDWESHNPYAAFADERSEAARKAARARWEKKDNAKSVRNECDPHANGTKSQCPLPSPSPSPNPKNKNDTSVSSDEKNAENEYVATIKTTDENKPLQIKKANADQWQQKFKFIDVEAELYRLSQWADQNPDKRWTPKQSFFACSGALGKKNQQALLSQHERDPTFDPSDPDGSKKAETSKKRTLELVNSMANANPYN